ncbi:CehA/McbA family metallohydrolase [Paenibacillus massiliensis]|uniref:CehA/McbA family metallohydrolase n=1 Tax=Paenibacillus massiliensis TaxID=225917 RepID=UPI000414A3F1|nr:CehA/McbA family metallohydrolase [Paenibacillus massiliensis]
MRWLGCELHTHTLHSDGKQTLSELAAGAVQLGFDAIALTDHNTMSGLDDREELSQEHGLLIIPGMEWTTFYGHMVTLGLNEFADWRKTDRTQISSGIQEVQLHGGIAGLAHPYRIGSPACTGCYWEYEIHDWSKVNYIEVWSGTFASIKISNQRAYSLWTDKLNAGYRIAATSGRDWHEQIATEEPISVTYLGIPADTEPTEADLVQALSVGRASVTIGPLLTLELEVRDDKVGIGSVVRRDSMEEPVVAHISLDFTVRSGLWRLQEQTCRLVLCSNLGIEDERDIPLRAVSGSEHYEATLNSNGRQWLRAELWGTVQGANTLIAFTNAIYFE